MIASRTQSECRNLPPISATVEDKAVQWVADLDKGLGAAEERTFRRWRSSDPRHVAAVEKLTEAWAAVNRPRLTGGSPSVLGKIIALKAIPGYDQLPLVLDDLCEGRLKADEVIEAAKPYVGINDFQNFAASDKVAANPDGWYRRFGKAVLLTDSFRRFPVCRPHWRRLRRLPGCMRGAMASTNPLSQNRCLHLMVTR